MFENFLAVVFTVKNAPLVYAGILGLLALVSIAVNWWLL